MGLRDRFINKIAGDYVKREVTRRLAEAMPFSDMVDKDDYLYRNLTSNFSKDLSPLKQDRMFQIAYHLWENNPLAHRIIEITKDFVVGEGITYTAKDEKVKQLLDDFWYDPVNLWDLKQHQKALELGLYGEQCYAVFVNEHTGKVRLGYVDPLQIDQVITNKENCEIVEAVKLRGTADVDGRILKVVQLDEGSQSETYGYLMGECFFFKVNSVSNSPRGRSDLLSLADWIDGYDQFLFNRLDRAALINAFVWDITLKGLTQEEIDLWLKQPQNKAPKPGSIRAHNENIEYKPVTPDLKAHDASEEARLIKNHILGGAGLPEHWFAEGGNANRATAAEMGEPTIKRLAARQRYFKYMIKHIFSFVLDQAIIHRQLPPNADLTFDIIVPQISVEDIEGLTNSLQRITVALLTAEERGWLSKEKAAEIFAILANRLGVDYEVKDEIGKAQKDKQDNATQDYT